MKKVFYFFCLLFFCHTSNAQFQGIVVNEMSQGPSGSISGIAEYIELVIVGKRTCFDSTADIRQWIVDDNNGWLGAASGQGTALGHVRFSNDVNWQKVPFGSIILLYNDLDRNPAIQLLNDQTDSNKDLVYIVPISSSILEKNITEPSSPSSSSYTYPPPNAPGYVTTTILPWSHISLNNTNDGVVIVSPTNRGAAYFSIGYGPLLNPGYATVYKAQNGSEKVYFLTDNQYSTASSWFVGDVGTSDESPGNFNTIANEDWIRSMRARPPSPFITASASPTAVCAGSIVAMQSSSSIPYNYTWTGPALVTTTGASVTAKPNGPAPSATYTVTGVSGSCNNSTDITVTINPLPTINAVAAKNTICSSGTGTTLTASGVVMNDSAYVWSPLTGLNAGSLESVVARPTVTTTYTVTGKDTKGCTNTASVTVNVVNGPAPRDTITGAGITCPGSSVPWGYPSIYHVASNIYSWSGPGGFGSTSRFVNVSTPGTYFLTIENAAGCRTVSQKTLTSQPVSGAISGSTTLCGAQEVQLEVKFTGGTPTTRYAFTYSVNGGAEVRYPANPAEFSEAPIVFDVFPPNIGVNTYTLKSVSSETCGAGLLFAGSDVATITVGKPPAPVASVTQQPNCSTPTGSIKVTSPAPNPGLLTYTVTGTGPFSGTSSDGIFTNLNPDTYQVTYSDANGCLSEALTLVINTSASAPPPPIASAQSFCNAATVANLVASGNAIQWYASASGGTPLAANTTLVHNSTYYASQTIAGCESNRTPATVTLGNLSAPTAATPQTFCVDSNPTIGNLIASGNNLQWYGVPNNGSPLTPLTALNNNSTYYVSQTAGGCESARTPVLVTITNPVAPTANAQSFCSTANATVANLVASGTSLKWYNFASGGTPLLPSDFLSNTTYYVSQTVSGCESPRTSVAVTILNVASPTANPQSFCSTPTPTVANLTANGTGLKWYSTALNGTPLSANTPLSNNATYYVSQTVNGCESGRTAVTATINAITTVTANDARVCSGTIYALVGNPSGGIWSGPNVNSATGNFNATGVLPGTYTVRYEIGNGGGCDGFDDAIITVLPQPAKPNISASNQTQTFCEAANPTIDSLRPRGATLVWYNVSQGGIALPASTVLRTQTYYVTDKNADGCESVRSSVNAIINPTPVVSVKSTASVCVGNGGTVTFTGTPGATVTYSVNGAPRSLNIESDGTTDVATGPLSDNVTYQLTSITLQSCQGLADTSVTVIVTKLPVVPPDQTFCFTNRPTVANLAGVGTNLQWYRGPFDVAPLDISTRLQTGPYYVNAKDPSGCVTGRIQINVNVPATTTPVPLKPYQTFCNANAIVANLDPSEPEYTWYENETGGMPLTPTSPLKSQSYWVSRTIVTNGVPCESEGRGEIIADVKTPPVQPTAAVTNATCTKQGSIKVDNVTGGNIYVLKGNNYNTFNQTGDFTNLMPGNYKLTMQTGNCTSAETSLTVTTATNTVKAIVSTSPAPCGQSTGTITVNAFGGTPPYAYKINNQAYQNSTNIYSGLAAGTYNIIVKDAVDCTFDTLVVVTTTGSIIKVTAIKTNASCGQNNGSITITPTGGNQPYAYKVNGMVVPNGNLTALGAGTYSININDAASCTFDTTISVTSNGSAVKVSATKTDAACGQSNGSITVTPSGGGPYAYKLNGVVKPGGIFTNLSAGSYLINITDAASCAFDTTIVVASQGSTLSIAANKTDASCGQSNGSINLSPTGGASPYTYKVNGTGSPGGNITALAAGSYLINITDAAGCAFDTTIVIASQGSTIKVSAIKTDASCGQSNGSITVNPTGGNSPYSYKLNGTAKPSGSLTALAAGSYLINITDATGCIFDTTIVVASQGSAIKVLASKTDASCGQNNGSITVAPSGGSSPYTYKVNGAVKATGNMVSLAAGSYLINVTDATGCAFDTTIVVASQGSAIKVSASKTDAACGQSNGSITLTPSGGNGPYTYKMNGTVKPNGNLSTLAAGSYLINIADATGCTLDTTIVIASITNAITQTSTLTGCISVVYKGVTYSTSNLVRDTIRTAANCDSIYRITNIDIQNNPPITQVNSLSGCDSVIYRSQRYTTSTIVRDTLRTVNGCDSVYVITDINVTSFNLTLSASANPAFEGTTVMLSATSTSQFQAIAWQPAYLFPSQTSAMQKVVADTSRLIKVIGESNSGCVDTAQVFVEVKEYSDFFIPNAFSPNNDGKNDLFFPMGTTISTGKVRIFNQWGGLVFSTDEISKGWDGMFNGKQQPVGVYIYEVWVTMRNGSEVKRKGFVNLIR